MRVLIIDDDRRYCTSAAKILREYGIKADAILARGVDREDVLRLYLMDDDGQKPVPYPGIEPALEAVRAADVIFIDHTMPDMNGDEMLDWFRLQGINFDNTRLVSCSGGDQDYLKEQFCELLDITSTTEFLGITEH